MLSEKIEKYVIERTEAFKKELDEEVKQMIKEANQGQVKSVWDLKIADREKYYRLYSDGDIDQVVFYTDYDEQARDIGNAFLTREETEFEKERRKIETILRKYGRPFKVGEENWYIAYYHDEEDFSVTAYSVVDYGIPYFESEEMIKKAIYEIGEDRLKKYWFGVEG